MDEAGSRDLPNLTMFASAVFFQASRAPDAFSSSHVIKFRLDYLYGYTEKVGDPIGCVDAKSDSVNDEIATGRRSM
jgi:hypothetical protein